MTDRPDTYKTIKSPSEGLYKEKGSRFIAFAWPVGNEEEIKSILEETKENIMMQNIIVIAMLSVLDQKYGGSMMTVSHREQQEDLYLDRSDLLD